ncbi:hypothetical protein [Nonomuraea sp. GTA35]|uniref:hypothetical protein n=1 Tax=Nonomuraea sp. GTA35 TaxID=1676746 RepID=UPI0035C095AE
MTKAEVAEHVYNTHYSNLSKERKRTVWMAWKAQTDPDAVNAWVKKTLAERNEQAMTMVRDFLWALFIDDYPECARGDAIACAGIIPWGKAIGLPAKVIRKLVSKADDTVDSARKSRKNPKPTGDHYLLGLSDQGLTGLAKKLGLKHFMNLNAEEAAKAFEEAVKRGAKFTFNLDGFVPKGKTVKQAIEEAMEGAGEIGPRYGNVTNWELYILHKYGRLGEVTFILDGKKVKNPFR